MKSKLIAAAKKARLEAYAPYSNFLVGAAVMTSSGEIFSGSNIENSSYSLTCCAERVAIFQAIASGHRSFKALVVLGDTHEPIIPCGACCQVMNEFFDQDTIIYLTNLSKDIKQVSMRDLLPYSFDKGQLNLP